MKSLSGWGNYPKRPTEMFALRRPDDVREQLLERSGIVARGAGRAYGDAAVGTHLTVCTLGLNRMRDFDPSAGTLTVEAGVTIADMLATFVPRGYFLKAVPGTKFVTVGGAIAADVHGKNHHRDGGFGKIVRSLQIVLPNREVVTCSRQENSELFSATIGGMGLTGVIIEATIELLPIATGWLRQEIRSAENLNRAIDLLDESEGATYSVAWIDCLAKGSSLGRSLIYLAEHATSNDRNIMPAEAPSGARTLSARFSVPTNVPSGLLNRNFIRLFNEVYFRHGLSNEGKPRLVHWDPYFFPLDAVGNWNALYGRRGFIQHQCVIPQHCARAALAEIMDRVSRRGDASFLAVLKKLGDGSGLLSFPLRGYTLAMDFPANPSLFPFLDELDDLIVRAGGRMYLAKDARQSRTTFEAGYAGLESFKRIRSQVGASKIFASHLSSRLGL